MKDNFIKISELKGEDRTKVRDYWTPLWGAEFAKALVTDYSAESKQKEVEAKNKKMKK